MTHLSSDAAQDRKLNSLQWYVLWQLARLKGMKVKRKVEGDRIRVMVMFGRVMSPDSAVAWLETPGVQEPGPLLDPSAMVVWALLPDQSMQETVLASLSRGSIKHPRMLKNMSELADTSELPHCIVTTGKVINSPAFTYWRKFAQQSADRAIVVIEVTAAPEVFEARKPGPRNVIRLSAADVPGKLVSTILLELEHTAQA
ncbi:MULTISPECIES: hypothetical protein [unclassified Polaromonas]|uniref:hypothetical protein n=1 Tax=unclassified Polaromonas TaxID=2638319 RepID=UPI000F075463|nr:MULTISPECIES: hypothetical protein [unclassified Polaromonas]AYQ27353.1 hypothetical protein DT070_04470 [Polaromonas sp. SP1]QGJ17806.1 hypothetical protein F7R28_04980 [Polaromonas sp. Pch-P]